MAALREVASGHVKIVPDVQVGSDGGGVIGGLGALLMRSLAEGSAADEAEERPSEAAPPEVGPPEPGVTDVAEV